MARDRGSSCEYTEGGRRACSMCYEGRSDKEGRGRREEREEEGADEIREY